MDGGHVLTHEPADSHHTLGRHPTTPVSKPLITGCSCVRFGSTHPTLPTRSRVHGAGVPRRHKGTSPRGAAAYRRWPDG
jgi:hypothetical protein